jgi:hypothetical protein
VKPQTPEQYLAELFVRRKRLAVAARYDAALRDDVEDLGDEIRVLQKQLDRVTT